MIDIKKRKQILSMDFKEPLQGNQYKKVNEPHYRNLYKNKITQKNHKVNSKGTPLVLTLKKIKTVAERTPPGLTL